MQMHQQHIFQQELHTTNLHPPMMGMTDIASWILKCMKENNVGVEVKATLPLADLTE